ncbi:hypothetical protein [Aquabacterium sp. OR-4]|uniref:hypothetical protein n=1 Tax=Aquabacterium sp. OR-4 TaxID=2978127 RepID=UPI0028C78DC0|nr:hypothetical protein [Aquabacterium sp. OR-4]MDT7834489.1 hypothetical protein [Aquabacterium sp. OR-4]
MSTASMHPGISPARPAVGRQRAASPDRIRKGRVAALMLILPMFFSFGRYVPGFEWTLDLMALATFASAVYLRRSVSSVPLGVLPRYTWLIILAAPLWGATMAVLVFGQPAWLGLATQRALLLAPFGLVLTALLHRGAIRMVELEQAFVWLAWLNLGICSPVLLLLDPNNYSDLGNLVTDGGGVYNQFNLPMTFVIFGAFYYFAKALLLGRAKWYARCVPFLLYIFGGNTGRVLNVAMLLSFLLLAALSRRRGQAMLRNVATGVGLFAAGFGLTLLLAPDRLDLLSAKYTDAFAALSGADSVDDWSANARILQVATVTPWVEQHLWFGTGTISNRWNDGYKGLFDYLHPSDLGFLGVIFVYGVFGLLAFSYQYVLAWRGLRALGAQSAGFSARPFLLGLGGCLATLLLTSVTTGSLVFFVEQTLFYISMLHFGRALLRTRHG